MTPPNPRMALRRALRGVLDEAEDACRRTARDAGARLRGVVERRQLGPEGTALRDLGAIAEAGAPPEAIIASVAERAAPIVRGRSAIVARHTVGGDPTIVAKWPAVGPTPGTEAVDRAIRTGLPAIARRPASGMVAVPLRLEGRIWGALAVEVVATRRGQIAALARLARFALLVLPALAHAVGAWERSRRSREEIGLRRLATAVAGSESLAAVFALALEEAGALTEAEAATVVRVDGERIAVTAAWSAPVPLPAETASALARSIRTRRPARAVSHEARAPIGPRASAAAPIPGDGLPWGAIVVERDAGRPFPPETEETLGAIAELLSLGIRSDLTRARLSAEARSDELTGLGNRRAFGERLAEEVERARRYGHPLSLVAIDLDDFKAINDRYGHQVGDEVLTEAARRLGALVRSGEMVARIGGDELMWLLPETDAAGAERAADRAREAISGRAFPVAGRVSASAGVCDLAQAGSASELVRGADLALLAAKRAGRATTGRLSDREAQIGGLEGLHSPG